MCVRGVGSGGVPDSTRARRTTCVARSGWRRATTGCRAVWSDPPLRWAMESFRQSMRQSLHIESPQGSCCRKVRPPQASAAGSRQSSDEHARVVPTQVMCGLLLLLACRWFVVVWQLRAIVPLPLVYGIGVLPVLTLVGVMVPFFVSAGDGCGCGGGCCRCLCSDRGRQAVSVLCASLDVAL